MSLRLAPYNDAMRLGQGFNSYTHELCIDGAVKLDQRTVNHDPKGGPPNPSQVVSYSARCVEKLSDIVEAMNLSYSSSIKKGTIEITGNSTTIDENTFKLSDLNVVVSVRVVNQTISTEDESNFIPLKNQETMAARFNEIYGDSYISGFIEGGDFSGIVSIKVIDRSKVNNIVNTIKSNLLSTGNHSPAEANYFTLGPSIPIGANIASSELSAALKDTETTISINWMGGGQIKQATQSWDIDSLYAAAAAFPASVAKCPQRTWAIVAPYRANRSFIDWCMHTQSPVKTLQYDLIASYTAELFDRFMDYKFLLKRVQHILSSRTLYRSRLGLANAIETEVPTLLCLRAALRNEQSKIVEAIEVLAKDPTVLKRQATWANGRHSEVVRRIVEQALRESKDWQPVMISTHSGGKTVSKTVPWAGGGRGGSTEPDVESQPQADILGLVLEDLKSTATALYEQAQDDIISLLESLSDLEGGASRITNVAARNDEAFEKARSRVVEELRIMRNDWRYVNARKQVIEQLGILGEEACKAAQKRWVDTSVAARERWAEKMKAVHARPSSRTEDAEAVKGSLGPRRHSGPAGAAVKDQEQATPEPKASVPNDSTNFNFDTLIAPEVWEDLLPELAAPVSVPLDITAPVTNVGPLIGPETGGLASFNLTIPSPDDHQASASNVIQTKSYVEMEEKLRSTQEELRLVKEKLQQAHDEANEREATYRQKIMSAEEKATRANSHLIAKDTEASKQVDALKKKLSDLENGLSKVRNKFDSLRNALREKQRHINQVKAWLYTKADQVSPSGHHYTSPRALEIRDKYPELERLLEEVTGINQASYFDWETETWITR